MFDNSNQFIESHTKLGDDTIVKNQSMLQGSMGPLQEYENESPAKNQNYQTQADKNILITDRNLPTQNTPQGNQGAFNLNTLPSNEDLIQLTGNIQPSAGQTSKNHKNQQQIETTNKQRKQSPNPTGMFVEPSPRYGAQKHANLSMIERQRIKEKNLQVDHCLSIKELQKLYKFDIERGLDDNLVVENRSLSEKNKQNIEIKMQSQDSSWDVIKCFLFEFRFSILLAAIIFFFSYGNYLDDPSQVLLGLLLLWVIIVDKKKSHDELSREKFQKIMKDFIPKTCKVIREGKEQEIFTSRVVIGDIIILNKDSIVPVDCRVYQINLEQDNQILKSDQSFLLKNKLPRTLNKICSFPTQYLKSSNVILQGAKIVEGSGKAIAILSANESYCQKTLSQAISYNQIQKKVKNPIKSEVYFFATLFSYLSLAIGVVFLLVSYLKFDTSLMSAFIFAGCVIVAFVPEGLLTQLYFAKYMRCCILSKKEESGENSFHVNEYSKSVETLGRINCICSNISSFVDHSRSEVNGLWLNGQTINSHNEIYGDQAQNASNQTYQNLLLGSILANESYFTSSNSQNAKTQIDQEYLPYEAEGSYNDAAFIRFCQPILDVSQARQQYPIAINNNGNHVIVSYDQQEKYTISVVEQESKESDYVLYIKGAPERILKLCSQVEINGQQQALSEELNKSFSSALRQFAKQGETVLAIAKLPLSKSEFNKGNENEFFDKDYKLKINLEKLTMLGMISLTNPISNSFQSSIIQSKLSGTKLFIITEYDARTTLALAIDSGLISDNDSKTSKLAIDEENESDFNSNWEDNVKRASSVIVNANRLQFYSQQKDPKFEQFILDWLMKDVCIFTSASIQQKQLLISYLRKLGYTIAATSNDLEDLQFICSADISFAGTGSTPFFQRLSDVHLIRNKYQSDIQSILEAIEEGRSHEENAKKIFAFSGSTKMAQIIPLMAYIILRIPLSLSAMFMILVSCLTNFIPALSLAEEDPDVDAIYVQSGQNKFDPKTKQLKKSNKVATFSLFFYSYFFLGAIASAAGFCAFYTTMNHLGFPVRTIFGIFDMYGYLPNQDTSSILGYDEDVMKNYLRIIEPYQDISAHTALNSNMPQWNSLFMMPNSNCLEDIANYKPKYQQIDWNDFDTSKFDLRKFYVYCDHYDYKWKSSVSWSYCDPDDYVNYSTLTENSACYTPEALNYGQTAYLLALVFFQFSNLFALKSLRYSFAQTPFNGLMVFSFFIQLIICVILVEIPGIQLIFRSRPLSFWQWGLPAVPFSIFVLLHEELRKYLVRSTNWFRRVATF